MSLSEATGLRRFCVAPMMDWTDRHCRYFMRLLTRRALLYTEMVTAAALLHGDTDRLLAFNAAEQPVALQLGGSDPGALAQAARLGEQAGYLEINLNVGCPSDRVQAGRFGACLMAEPALVARCVEAMKANVTIPVTVKTRIGIDDREDFDFLATFVKSVSEVGCETLIVHARKAWLSGLSPKQNREIPTLNYARVYELKQQFSELEVIINGGIESLADAEQHLQQVDGVMMGRAAYHNPYLLAEVDGRFYGDSQRPSRAEVLAGLKPYIERELEAGTRLHSITRHILGLYAGQPGAKRWRRYLSEHARLPGRGAELLDEALASRAA